MAAIDDFLNDVDTMSIDEEYCTIDTNTRQITIPESLLPLGVVSDEDSRTIRFRMKNIFGNYEDKMFFINFQNAAGTKGVYAITDVVENDEGELEFSWTLSRPVTMGVGVVLFILCVRRMNENEEIDYEWNSTLARAKVLEGLEVDDQGNEIDDDETIIAQLIIAMNNSGALGVVMENFLEGRTLILEDMVEEFKGTINEQVNIIQNKFDKAQASVDVANERLDLLVTDNNLFRMEEVLYEETEADGKGLYASGQVLSTGKNLSEYDYLEFTYNFFGKVSMQRVKPVIGESVVIRSFNLPNSTSTKGVSFSEITLSFSNVPEDDQNGGTISVTSASKLAWSGNSSDSTTIETSSLLNGDSNIAGSIIKIVGAKYPYNKEIEDLRIKYDGEVSDSAGRAVREQFANFDERIKEIGDRNFVEMTENDIDNLLLGENNG